MRTAVAVIAFTLAASLCVSHAMDFVVMGDWGGSPDAPYTTGAEKEIASTMDTTAGKLGAKFGLALGDNFYDSGVTSLNDPRFKTTFEGVFTGANLKSPFKFHVLAGNHDHRGNVSAQIAYSGVDSRWSFPTYYYTFTETAKDGSTVQFVMIDTVLLVGNSQLPDGTDLPGDALPGPDSHALAQTQWQWIESTLAASTADYIIVAGHYPVWSICEHGPTSGLVSTLKPMLEKYKVSAYFCGHDHCAEHIDDNSGVQYHVIGAAHGCDDSTEHSSAVPSGSLKFHYGGKSAASRVGDFDSGIGAWATVHADSDGLVVKHLKGTGEELYTAPAIHKRS